jgi:thiol-disulfide isomerase/thioredoxin
VLRLLAIGCVVGALVEPARAGQATCSNPGVPVGAAQSSELLPGRLTLNLTTGLLPISSSELLDDVSGQVRYDSHLVLVETRLGAEYAISPYLAVGGALPYRVVDVSVHYFDPTTGAPLQPTFAGIHSRPETIDGIGDASLHVHGALSRGGFHLHGRLGTTLPLGGTLTDDPFELGKIGQEHEHIQLGTGTAMPFAALEAQHAAGPATVAVWGVAYLSLYENGHGYRPGSRISGGLTASSGLGSHLLTFSLAAEVHGETAEKWHGVVPVDEGNAGRVDVFAGGSVSWRASTHLAVVADLKAPVYSHISGNQLDYGVVAGLSFVGSFDVTSRPSYRGLDEREVGPPGSATPVVPVAGKLTVFDLWADWCAPCRVLDEQMVALARRYPDRIAVRKLEVIDADSAAWKAFLAPGNFALPHIKVYRADGTLLFERTAPPAELVRAVEDALR